MAREIAAGVGEQHLRKALAGWIVTAAQSSADAEYWQKRAERAERKLKKT